MPAIMTESAPLATAEATSTAPVMPNGAEPERIVCVMRTPPVISTMLGSKPFFRKIPSSFGTQNAAVSLRMLEWPMTIFSNSCAPSGGEKNVAPARTARIKRTQRFCIVAILMPLASRLTPLGIDILLKPFERQRAADAALDGEIVDRLRHCGELDPIAGSAVVAPAVAAVGEDRDLLVAVPAGIFSRDQIGDLRRAFEQLVMRRNVERV